MLAGVVRTHPQQREHQDRGVGTRGGDHAFELRVGIAVDRLNGITARGASCRIVIGVLGIVVSPTLVSDAVGFRHHCDEEVPVLRQQVDNNVGPQPGAI